MVANHYRWDFIGLSTQAKPTPATSEKVVDGSTFYEANTSKLFVFCKNNWYEKTVSGGGGGTSDFDELTNRPKYNGTAMTGETNIPEPPVIYADAEKTKIQIGDGSSATGNNSIAIGKNTPSSASGAVAIGINDTTKGAIGPSSIAIGAAAYTSQAGSVAIGVGAATAATGSIALGAYSAPSTVGEINVGTTNTYYGYNSTKFRLIRGVHNGSGANDAVNVGQINGLIDAINTATGSNISHIGS